jgi:signal transduction histidine kinase
MRQGRAFTSTTSSLRRRLAAVLVGAGVVAVGLVVLAIVLLIQVRSQQHQVINRYFTAVNTANEEFVAQLDAETAVRGYALTHAAVAEQPLQEYLSPHYRSEQARLHALLDGDAGATSALAAWTTATQAWYDDWAVPTISHVHAGNAGALSTADVLTGKALFDVNRAKYATFSSDLVVKRNAASNALQLRTTLLFAAVLVTALGVAAAGAALWLALRRWVVDPVTALGREARLVRSGALDHEVTVTGPAEIRTLAADVDDMRRDIVAQLIEVRRARAEIDAARLVLEEQAEELARSNRDLEQFAYVASHDLQEPLRKVASFCQMLERRYAGQLDERADTYIAFAVDGAKRMQQLINDLLTFSRVGRMSQGMADVDMQAVFDAALSNLAGSIESTGATVTADPLPRLTGERTLLVQLLQNLIGNGVKFAGEEPPKVHIGVIERDTEWQFSCSDEGIGIEPQYAERIFVIFQRLHGKEEYAGTGIGLALCKRIVEHHGGRIWLDTHVSRGTTFRWTLPKMDQTEVASSATAAAPSLEDA